MREGVHLWRRAPRHRKWKMKSNFDFILKNLAEKKESIIPTLVKIDLRSI